MSKHSGWKMWPLAARPIGFLAIVCAVIHPVSAEEKKTSGKCNFEAYRPLRFGSPIRGGHEDLAIAKVTPIYPPEAQEKGIGGRVVVQVLIDRAGDVVKTCGVGPSLLTPSAESAVSRWRFQKDFGLAPSPAKPLYAVLTLSFDFDPKNGGQGKLDMKPSVNSWPCAQKALSASDEHGVSTWLGSEDLMRRVVKKSDLTFPMLGHGHLRGEVVLDLLIDEQGHVACARAISGHPIAIASAMASIQTWRFKPFVQRNKGIAVFGHLTIPYDVSR